MGGWGVSPWATSWVAPLSSCKPAVTQNPEPKTLDLKSLSMHCFQWKLHCVYFIIVIIIFIFIIKRFFFRRALHQCSAATTSLQSGSKPSFFISLMCSGNRRIPTTCCTNRGSRIPRRDTTLRAGGMQGSRKCASGNIAPKKWRCTPPLCPRSASS